MATVEFGFADKMLRAKIALYDAKRDFEELQNEAAENIGLTPEQIAVVVMALPSLRRKERAAAHFDNRPARF